MERDALPSPSGIFYILHKIGSGSYGNVYKVLNLNDQLNYAAKMMEVKTKIEKIDLQNEINILKKLDHPNLLKFYGSFQDNKMYWIVTEICICDWNHFKDTINLTTDIFYLMMQNIMSGIAYLHSSRIVHRDIKSENIFIRDSKPFFLLGDLGVSKFIEEKSQLADQRYINRKKKAEESSFDLGMNTLVGTPAYMPPEIIRTHEGRQKFYGERIDVYSAAIVAYFTLSDKLPYIGDSVQSIMKKIRKGSSKLTLPHNNNLIIDIPNEVRQLLNNMLRKKSKYRPDAEYCCNEFAKLIELDASEIMDALVKKLIKRQEEIRKRDRSILSSRLKFFNENSWAKHKRLTEESRIKDTRNLFDSRFNSKRSSVARIKNASSNKEDCTNKFYSPLKLVRNRLDPCGNPSKVNDEPRRYSVGYGFEKSRLEDSYDINSNINQENDNDDKNSSSNIAVQESVKFFDQEIVERFSNKLHIDVNNPKIAIKYDSPEEEALKSSKNDIMEEKIDHTESLYRIELSKVKGNIKYMGAATNKTTIIYFDNCNIVIVNMKERKEYFRLFRRFVKAILPLKFNDLTSGLVILDDFGNLIILSIESIDDGDGREFQLKDETILYESNDPDKKIKDLRICYHQDFLVANSNQSIYRIKDNGTSIASIETLLNLPKELEIFDQIMVCNCTSHFCAAGEVLEIIIVSKCKTKDNNNENKVYQCTVSHDPLRKNIRECILSAENANLPVKEALYINNQKIFADLPQSDYIAVVYQNHIFLIDPQNENQITVSFSYKTEIIHLNPMLNIKVLQSISDNSTMISGQIARNGIEPLKRCQKLLKTCPLYFINASKSIVSMAFIKTGKDVSEIPYSYILNITQLEPPSASI